jgi:catechol 2,3-dioxygenase-like lactoylglutathione lyase family enzyme
MEEKIFEHVAVSINDPAEIKNFYVDILGLEIKNKFKISKTISNKIFDIEQDTEVVVVGKNDFKMELFISPQSNYRNFQHICIMANERGRVVRKAQDNNYTCSIIRRDTYDTVFIQDKSNNLFEIKESFNTFT